MGKQNEVLDKNAGATSPSTGSASLPGAGSRDASLAPSQTVPSPEKTPEVSASDRNVAQVQERNRNEPETKNVVSNDYYQNGGNSPNKPVEGLSQETKAQAIEAGKPASIQPEAGGNNPQTQGAPSDTLKQAGVTQDTSQGSQLSAEKQAQMQTALANSAEKEQNASRLDAAKNKAISASQSQSPSQSMER